MPNDKQFAYVLASMCESKAMSIRLNEEWCNQPGHAAHFIQRVSRQVAKSMHASWAGYIPTETSDQFSESVLRDTVLIWDRLGLRLSSMLVSLSQYQCDWLCLLYTSDAADE